MDYVSVAACGAAFVISAIAFAYGAVRLLTKNTLVYFQFLIWGVACFALLALSACVSYVCNVVYEPYVSLGSFGSVGVYIAFLSANFGALDKIVDERTPRTRKARYLALIVPAVVAGLSVWLCTKYMTKGFVTSGILLLIVSVPMILSCYFNIKHLLLPMDAMQILNATKGCNVMCLVFVFIEFFYMWAVASYFVLLADLFFILRAAALLALMIFAVRGSKKWQL